MPVSIRDDYPLGCAREGSCVCCGAGRRDLGYGRVEKVVDLGVSFDFEGFLMICETCVREAAGLLGMIEPDQRDEALAHAASMAAENDRLQREHDEAVTLVETVISFRERHAGETMPEGPVRVDLPNRVDKVRSSEVNA